MLALTTFDHLTHLELVTFTKDSDRTAPESLARTRALTRALRNALSLEKLVFSGYAAISITDIEALHAAATRHKHLELINLTTYTDNAAENQVQQYHPSNALLTFKLKNVRTKRLIVVDGVIVEEEHLTFDIGHTTWISYIGRKYPQLQSLSLDMELFWCYTWLLMEVKKY